MRPEFEDQVRQLHDIDRTVTVDESRARQCDSFKHKLEGIISEPKKRNGRTDEAIVADIVSGMVAELAVADLLGVEVFDAPWDLKDRSTFAKDVVYNGIRIEVKSHKHLRRFAVPEHSYHTMMKSVDQKALDAVVFSHVERAPGSTGIWMVTPTVIADPYPEIVSFRDLFDLDDYSYVYRADLAYRRGLCHTLIDLDP